MIILRTKASIDTLKKILGRRRLKITQEGDGKFLITGSQNIISAFLKDLKESRIEFRVEERGYTDEAVI